MPALLLKKMVMGNFDKGIVDEDICDSIDFLVERVKTWKFWTLFVFHKQSKKWVRFLDFPQLH